MASTGEVYAGSTQTISESPWLDEVWINPTNAVGSANGTMTSITAATFDTGDQSQVLKAYNYGFSIPAGATITGVIVRIKAAREMAGSGEIGLVQLLDTSRAKTGTNQASTPTALTLTGTEYTFGSSSNLWGLSLTEAWVEDADFGVAIGFQAAGNNTDVEFDAVSIEVFYTLPTVTSTAEVSLASGSTPSTFNNHAINFRARVQSGTGKLYVSLYEGATERYASSGTTLTTSLADYSVSIDSTTAQTITDYSNLSIQFYGEDPNGGSTVFEVDKLWLQVDEGSGASLSLDAQPGSFAVTGAAVTPNRALKLNAVPASYAVTGVAAGLGRGFFLDAQPGSYALTGFAATFLRALKLNAAPGSYALTGLPLTGTVGRSMNAVPGSFGVTGFAVALPRSIRLNASPGSFAVTGLDAAFPVARVFNAEPGSFTITGIDAPFVVVVAGGTAFELDAQPGSFILTGMAAGLPRGLLFNAAPTSYAVTGAPTGLSKALTIVAQPGIVTVTGVAAGLGKSFLFSADPGSFAVTGIDTGLGKAFVFSADPASFAVSGEDVGLSRGITFPADPGSYVITGEDASGARLFVLVASPGSYGVTGQDAGLSRGFSLGAEPGVFVVSGRATDLVGPGTVIVIEAPRTIQLRNFAIIR